MNIQEENEALRNFNMIKLDFFSSSEKKINFVESVLFWTGS